jgi:hypothetical protein
VSNHRQDRVRFAPADATDRLDSETYSTAFNWTVRAHLGLTANF